MYFSIVHSANAFNDKSAAASQDGEQPTICLTFLICIAKPSLDDMMLP